MFAMKKTSSLIPVRIGGLLIAAGLIKPDQMALALSKARATNNKLGEVLTEDSLVTDEDLKCALELQKLIKAGNITVEMGTEALRQAKAKRCSVQSTLANLGYSDEKAIKTTDLASVLLDAGIVSKPQLEQASWNAAKNYLPLGRNLVLAGALSPSLLGAALSALVLLRDKLVDREQAIDALRAAHQQKLPFEHSLQQAQSTSQNHVRIGELLSSAGLLSESDAMIAVENGLLNQKSIGQVLLECHMVSPLVLDACLKLQKMVEDGSFSRVQASELLRQVATKQVGLEQYLNEMTYVKARVLELLVKSGLVSEAQIQQALAHRPEAENDMIRALFLSGDLTQEMFRACLRAIYAIDEGRSTLPDTISSLRVQFAA